MSVKTEEDLFAESTMTFGEHLEELRVCLFRAVIGLVLGTIVGLYFGDRFVEVIEAPLKGALKTYYQTQAETEYTTWAEKQQADGKAIPYTIEEIKAISRPDETRGEPEMIFELEFVHPAILQAAAGAATPPAVGAAVGAATPAATGEKKETTTEQKDGEKDGKKAGAEPPPADRPVRFVRGNLVPLLLWHPIQSDPRFSLQATGATEAFTVWLKASIVIGIVLSSPWVFYQLWTFVAAGLYPHERKYVYVYLPFSIGLFLAGAATAYLLVFKPVLDFLFQFNQSMGIDPDPKINEWLGFVMILPLGFGVSFQLPLVMLFLERIGVFGIDSYLQHWRISVLVIFIISAVLTPADPYSIFFMAVPLTLLYFGGVGLCKYFPKQTGPAIARR